MTTLAGKNILITGGAGFIGSWTAELLMAENPAQVVVIDNMIRGNTGNLAAAMGKGSLRLIQDAMQKTELLENLVAEADIVFHMAALRITQCAAEPQLAFDTMAAATFRLLDMCVRHKVEKVVAASSASVYGMADIFPTAEDHHVYNNRTLYGALKTLNEGLLRSFNDMYGLRYAAMRYFNAYGPRMDIHGKYTEVLVRWMERIEAGLPPGIFGDGLQTMDFVHVHDIARANILAAKADVGDDVFNVASGTETSLLQLAQALMRVMGRDDLSVVHEPARAVNPVPRRLADTQKAAAMLGFRATVDLDEGLRGLVQWWRTSQSMTQNQRVGV